MSRCAVSCEHFARFAHFDVVSLPSKPSNGPVRHRVSPLNFAALEDIRGKRSQNRFLLKGEAQRFHVPDKPSLPATALQWNRGQSLSSWMYFLRNLCGDYGA